MKIEDEESYNLFLVEAREHLGILEDTLLKLEKSPDSIGGELVNAIFRSAHTIKGGAGFFGLEGIKQVAHAMENALNLVREGKLSPGPSVCSALLEGTDMLGRMLDEPAGFTSTDYASILEALDAHVHGEISGHSALASSACIPEPGSPSAPLSDVQPEVISEAQARHPGGAYVYLLQQPPVSGEGPDAPSIVGNLRQYTGIIRAHCAGQESGAWEDVEAWEKEGRWSQHPIYILCTTMVEPDLMREFLDNPRVTLQIIRPEKKPSGKAMETTRCATAQAPDVGPKIEKTKGKNIQSPVAETNGKVAESGSIRVKMILLDKLMALAGELVLARNAMMQSMPAHGAEAIEEVSQRIDAITTDLQESIMLTRMQALGTVFGKFRRVVRDLAQSLGKQIEMKIEGEEVEVDKPIVEAISDPLTHLIRNAADHGIELPAVRTAKGKPPMGTITLRAYHEAGKVVLEILDDGAGMDPDRIRAKALENGLRTESELAAMSTKSLLGLIFMPGFSTAQAVSEVSGRGVGMDVVQTNLAKVGGTVDVESTLGQGSIIRVKAPLTLAIIPSLLVSVEGERYAIPQVNLQELVRVPASEVSRRLNSFGDAVVMRLRGDLLPLVDLKAHMGISATYVISEDGPSQADRREKLTDRRQEPETCVGGMEGEPAAFARSGKDRRQSRSSGLNVAIVSSGDLNYGIIVDHALDSAEIVVKPLGSHLASCHEYAGATILGDGQVAMILDVNGLRKSVGLMDPRGQDPCPKDGSNPGNQEKYSETQYWLIMENGPGERFGVPLGLVARIERIKTSLIESIGGKRAMTYRGGSLILLAIEDFAKVLARTESENAFVIVFKVAGREVGLLATEVLDTVDSTADIDSVMYAQPGILGAVVLDGKIIQIVDLFGMTSRMIPELGRTSLAETPAGKEEATVLIVEDTAFFLRQFKLIFEEAGYKVLTAENGIQGLQQMEAHGDKVSLIITDIEMPQMNGFAMTERLRMKAEYANLPIIAITSLSTAEAEKRGRSVGITEYLIKMDREQILDVCARHLKGKVAASGKARPANMAIRK